MSLPSRTQVPTADTWDLSAIFKDDFAFEQAIKATKELVTDFKHIYAGRLTQAPVIIDALADYAHILTFEDHLSLYADLPVSTDATDSALAARSHRVAQLLATWESQLHFVQAELSQQSDDLLDVVAASTEDNAAFIRHIKQARKQALAPAVEQALAQLGPVLDAPEAIRAQSVFADMDFGEFTVNGQTYPLSFTLYEETYQKHPDVAIRRAAYLKFCDTLAQYQNTMAAGYLAQVTKEKTLATMRGYDSVIDYLLADQEVPRSMFERQVNTLMRDLAPVMRRYVTHLKATLGLDRITYTDLQADLDPDFAPKVTRQQAPTMINAALQPLGADYQHRIARAFDERWVDFPGNIGKESGAFAVAPYGVHPYVLMSWADSLPSLYTLIHELGHCGQMTLADEHHNILGHEPSWYIVEAPSTFHELLLTNSLLHQDAQPRFERFALSRLLNDTYFHNCVTHLLEAAFQTQVYALIDAGESFDAAKLNDIKLGVLKEFWGDSVDLSFGQPALTWMRQSHYYMGLYSYTYSASLVVSTGAYLRLQAGDPNAASDWLHFLQLGDTVPPIEAAKVAGVDITTAKPLHDMIEFLDQSEQRIEALSAQL